MMNNVNRFLLQGFYDSEISSFLRVNNRVVEANELKKINLTDGWQVAIKKVVFDYTHTEGEIKVIKIPNDYNVDDWIVELYCGAWKFWKHNSKDAIADQLLMLKTRGNNDQ